MAAITRHNFVAALPDIPVQVAAGNIAPSHFNEPHVYEIDGLEVTFKEFVLDALGIDAWVITDTTLTISRVGADLVTRQTTIDLEVPV